MAIVKMKRLSLLALESDRDALFEKLQRLGCVEITDASAAVQGEEISALLHIDENLESEKQKEYSAVQSALAVLDRYAPQKTKFLAPKPQIALGDLFNEKTSKQAAAATAEIGRLEAEHAEVLSQIQKQKNDIASLAPWLPLDVPLNTASTPEVFVSFGMLPTTVELDALRQELSQEGTDASEIYEASSDKDMHYVLILCAQVQKDAVLDVLRGAGYSETSFKGITGTAKETTDLYTSHLATLIQKQESLEETIKSYAPQRDALRVYADRMEQDLQKETAKENLLATDKTFLLLGWAPVPELPKLEKLLGGYDCAYSLEDPTPEQIPDVPVQLKNNIFDRCLNMVTDMYSLPRYDNVDPNPLMAPFFILFYGIMMADMGYGILMVLIGLLVIRKKRPGAGTLRNFAELCVTCGISTFIFGALTGGFFGDFIYQLVHMYNPDSTFEGLPALFTPLNDTLMILIGAMALGGVQIITGMIIKFVESTKAGHFWDAMMDQGSWWLVFIGIAVGVIAGNWIVLIAGVIALICTQGRDRDTIIGKIVGGVSSLYDITSYFGDVLSYSRLMALMLSGSVIAQVFNTLAALTGHLVPFLIIFLIGHTLNFLLNLLSCYVHDLRLQCLEYFNKFYEDGGKPYEPLAIKTTYYDVTPDTN